jgi:lambda family phage portal protein
MQANWLDRTIEFVSPQAGLRRAKARLAGSMLANLAYDGVRSERRQGGWTTTGTSGNAETGPALSRLRDNARDLYRNNSFAKKIVRRRSKRVVGYGITPQADTGDEKQNEVIDSYWKKWVRSCASDHRMNFYGAQQLTVETEFVSGECLIRIWDRRASDGLDVPFQIQVLEPDYLDSAKTENLANGKYIIQGVQHDGIGRIEGYWLFGQHPGEVLLKSGRGLVSKFVPADLVIHHCQPERPGDVRAVTRFAAVVAKLRDIDEYADAEIVRKKIAACFVGMFEQPEGSDGQTAGAVVTDASGKKVEEFRPGMMLYGSPGSTGKFFAPPDSGDFNAHKTIELREVAAGTETPYVVMGEDWSKVNYSSYRAGVIDERDGVDQYRWNWFIPQVCDPIWHKFIDTLFLMGVVRETNYGVKWNPPPFDVLDREAEAQADQIELQIGKKTWPQLVGDQGLDPQQQIAQIEDWRARLEKAGVSFFPKSKEIVQSEPAPAQ